MKKIVITSIALLIAGLVLTSCNEEKQKTSKTASAPSTASAPTIYRTFAMIKPDAVAAKNTGKIIDLIEQNGFTIARMEKMQFSQEKAQAFYAIHKDRPFFNDLVTFMTSGPIVALVLEKENAVHAWRTLMGATDPHKAEPGTVRKLYGTSMSSNAAHGSDASETAAQEISLIFPSL